MKLFPAKCHERATLRKLWCQTGNSSLFTRQRRNIHILPWCLGRVANCSSVRSFEQLQTCSSEPTTCTVSEMLSFCELHWESRKINIIRLHYWCLIHKSYTLHYIQQQVCDHLTKWYSFIFIPNISLACQVLIKCHDLRRCSCGSCNFWQLLNHGHCCDNLQSTS